MNTKDSGIGIDPTSIPVIENLDIMPAVEKPNDVKPKPPKKVVKFVLFTIFIIILMGGVSFGVYYYLHLGEENKKNANFTINNVQLVQGLELPSDINYYGDFSKVDVSKCSIDKSLINIEEAGTYDYSVTCGKNKKTSQLTIIPYNNFRSSTQILYKKTNSDISAKEFIIFSNNSYTYSFPENSRYKDIMASTGLHSILINVSSEGREQSIYGVVLVNSSTIITELNCIKDNYSDIFLFDIDDNKISAIRKYDVYYNSIDELELDLKNSNNGLMHKDDFEGMILYNYNNNQLSLVKSLTNKMLSEELNTTISSNINDIKEYYENNLQYTCEIRFR